MAAVAVTPEPPERGVQQLTAVELPLKENPWYVGFIRILTALGAWLLIAAHIFRPGFKQFGLPLTFYLSIGIVVFCAKVRGVKVFARTPVDLAFVIWLSLAVLSQLWASMVLNRVLLADDILAYLAIILTTWFSFRAAFALSSVDPRTATGAFLKAILICLGIACMIGILQGYGPGPLKHWATEFGIANGAAGEVTELQLDMSSPRPLALFSGPNVFGFMNLVAMAILIGMTVAQGKNMSMKSVWLSAAGLSVFLLGTVVAQSRFAIATCLLLFAYFLYFMLRTGRTKVFVTGIVAIGAVVLVGLVFVQQMDLAYVQATFEKKITNDSSFRARQLGIDNLMDQAIDLAPLGAGWDSRGYSIDRTGDNWAKTNSIDNGYMQAFINHGIPGVLHLAFLFWSLWWVIRLARRHEYLHIRTLRVIAGLLLATYLVYSLSGVRHAKLESSVYWMVITGLLYGCVYGEKHFGEKFWLRKRPQPQLAA
ncbi:MAG: O-Antigen ligase [Fimbriimonadaceae bacterium]|jgi:hypothetical protein|nr:O-Antigen ligase [Fimbriimonadaceae bacterium]